MVKSNNEIKKSAKGQNIFQLGLVFIFLALINIISSSFFVRFDLTSEKRHTLSDNTKVYLKNLDDIVFFSNIS